MTDIHLQAGDKAPAFTGIDQNGENISLKDFKGRKLVLYFYPGDDPPTCTTQACNLRDNYAALKRKGFTIVGISADSVKSHKKFQTKYDLPFPLIADEDLKICHAYGVWQLKKFMGRAFMGIVRTTFIINEKGKIEHIITKPKSKIHTEEILAFYK
jgi:thioredoxin-dependent peroxiredoxin